MPRGAPGAGIILLEREIGTRNGEEEEELMRLQLAKRGILSISHNNSTSSTPGVSYREKKNKKEKKQKPP